MTILPPNRRTTTSGVLTDQPRQHRRRVIRLLRWILGDTVLYAMAKRLSKEVELRLLLRRLPVSSISEHRQAGLQLVSAVRCGNKNSALAIATNVRQKRDDRAEKIVSHRYGFIWICNPKVASRSIIQALFEADPEAIRVEEKTIEELFSSCPETRDYFAFAFVRDPCERARSFFGDKLDSGPLAPNWNVDRRFSGLRKGMPFSEYCRWLDTPFGSDVFAERHWLSQHAHIEAGGNLPDYVGSYENLEENWQWVLARLGVPYVALPHLNKHRTGAGSVEVDGESMAILHRRYERDYQLFGEVGSRGLIRSPNSP